MFYVLCLCPNSSSLPLILDVTENTVESRAIRDLPEVCSESCEVNVS